MSWDDGKHAKVKRVQLTFDDVIRSIEVEYDGTSVKSQQRGTVGTKFDGFTLSPDEYITEVNGYYKTVFSGDVITALTFKTNKKTYGTYGNKTRNYFSLTAPKDNQIAGFLGSSTNALSSIDAHFAPVPPPGSAGGNTGGTTGTGSNTSGTGTTGGPGNNTGGNGSTTTGGPGTNAGGSGSNTGGTGSNTGGSGATGGPGNNTGGNGSNSGNTGTTGGPGTGTESNPGGTGSTSGTGSNPGGTGTNTDSSPQKFEAQGGKGGNQWDDGADYDGVAKIQVVAGLGIEQIKFYYVKNGQTKEGPVHGVKARGFTSTVEISHPDEYLVSVEGWYDSSNTIQGIQFKTNQKPSEFFGYDFDGDGTQFSLQVKDKKIIGFHGFADSHLNSLGAYFVPISISSSPVTSPPNKVEAVGGNYGETFDDGAFDHIRKVYVGQGDSGVAYVKFDYEKDGKIESREHGKMSMLGTEEFEVDSGDYITSVEVYVDRVYGFKSEVVTALVFKTFKGKNTQLGMTGGNKYELKDGKGGKLAGFHGKASDVLYAIGAYFTPTSTSSSTLTPPPPKTPPPNKVEAQGGNYGETFDDGAFDYVRKVYVGQGDSGVAYVKFDYEKDGKIESREHGKMGLLGTEVFEVDSGDYITSVEVYVDRVLGFKSEVVTALVFKTFKGKNAQLGMTGGDKNELKDGKGGKLAGFHGKASDVLYAIGAYFTPTTN